MKKKENELLKKIAESPARALEDIVEDVQGVSRYLTNKKPVRDARGFWRTLGPGLTTGASDDDPAGITTYSQAGAQFGYQLLWLSPVTFPLMSVVQEMCARIGLVTGKGLAANIRELFPRPVLIVCTLLLFGANVFNIGADLGAMAKVSQLLFPDFGFTFLILFFTTFSLLLQIFSTYDRYAKYLKYLALVLFAYILSTLLIRGIDWGEIFRSTFSPSIVFSQEQLLIVCAVLGTTISPYLFFWQTSQEVEEEILEGKKTLTQRKGATVKEIKRMRVDVWSGMFLSNVIMFFIMTACAATLHLSGITTIATAADAAEALRPLAGNASYFLFAVGIVGTGLLAIPVLAGSATYAASEAFGWKTGLYNKLKNAYAFYGVLIIAMGAGLALNFFGIDPIKALIASAVLNGIIAPVILILILLISGNAAVMGKWVNTTGTQFFGWVTTILMAVAGGAAITSLFL